jgi:hypothetical protein
MPRPVRLAFIMALITGCSQSGGTRPGGTKPHRDGGSATEASGRDAASGAPDAAPPVSCTKACSHHGSCANQECTCETGYAGAGCDSCAAGYQQSADGTTCYSVAMCGSSQSCTLGTRECSSGRQRECVLKAGCPAWGAFMDCTAGACACASTDSGVPDAGPPPDASLPAPTSGVTIAQLGSAGSDQINGLAVGPDGEAIAVGSVGASLDGQPFLGMRDMFLAAKYVPHQAAKEWTKEWGSAADDDGLALVRAPDGVIYVAGDIGGMIDGHSPGGVQDVSLTRWNADRTRAWSVLWGSTSSETAWSVALHVNGSVYVAGYTSGDVTGTNQGPEDAILSRVGTDGTVAWTRQWGGAGRDYAFAVVTDAQGFVYVAGSEASQAFCRKLDADGNEQWKTLWGSTQYDTATGIALLAGGEMMLVGNTGGQITGATGSGGAFVSKLDASGKVLWTQQLGTGASDYARAVTVDSHGDVFVAGEVAGELVPGEGHGPSDDVFLQKRAADGTVLWTKQFGTSATERVRALAVAPSGIVYVGGSTDGSFPGFLSGGESDAFLLTLVP